VSCPHHTSHPRRTTGYLTSLDESRHADELGGLSQNGTFHLSFLTSPGPREARPQVGQTSSTIVPVGPKAGWTLSTPSQLPKELSGDWRLRSHTPLLTQNYCNSSTISFQTPAWTGRATSRKGPDGRVKGQTWLPTRLVVDGSTSPERPSLSSEN